MFRQPQPASHDPKRRGFSTPLRSSAIWSQTNSAKKKITQPPLQKKPKDIDV